MTPATLRADALAAIAWSAANGVPAAGVQVIVPRECNGRRARVAPGLMGEVLCCEASGTRVLLDAHDVLRWLDAGGGL